MTAILLLVTAGLALLVSLSVLVVRAMIARGVMDVPGTRSSHDRPTPKGGGWGVLAALLAGIAGVEATGLAGADAMPLAGFGVAALLLGSVAWADDVASFGFTIKLAAQAIAAMIVILSGFVIDRIGPWQIGALGVPLTLAWLIFAINAVNFIDGLNGLAAGCAAIVALASSLAAWSAGGAAIVPMAMLPLAAGLLGFLPYNFPNARIFMGDVGSQTVGLALAAMAGPLAGSGGPGAWGVLVMPMAMAPILVDVAFTLIRRLAAGRRLVEAHRGHLYQLARRAGWSTPRVTSVHLALTAFGSGCALVAAHGAGGLVLPALVAEAAAILVWMAAALFVARRAPIGPW